MPLTIISAVVWLIAASETGDRFAAATGLLLCIATWFAALLYGFARDTFGKELNEAPFLLGAFAALAYPITIYLVGCLRLGHFHIPSLEHALAYAGLVVAIGLVVKFCLTRGDDDLAA